MTSKLKITNKKSNRKPNGNGNVRIMVHSQLELNMNDVNLRKVDIALLPSNFDIFLRYAQTYQSYRIVKGMWRFYCLRPINTSPTANNPTYPLIHY